MDAAVKSRIVSYLQSIYGSLMVGVAEKESEFDYSNTGQFNKTYKMPYITDKIAVGLMQLNLTRRGSPEWDDWASYWNWMVNADRGVEVFRQKLATVMRKVDKIRSGSPKKAALKYPLPGQLENWQLYFYGGWATTWVGNVYIPNSKTGPTYWVVNPKLPANVKQYINDVRDKAYRITGDASVQDDKIP